MKRDLLAIGAGVLLVLTGVLTGHTELTVTVVVVAALVLVLADKSRDLYALRVTIVVLLVALLVVAWDRTQSVSLIQHVPR